MMDAPSVGMIKSKYMNGSNAMLTNSLVRGTNVGNTLQINFQESLVRTTDVPITPSKMYTQMDVNPIQLSNASSAMQTWTPKPVKSKPIKPESMDLWTDRLGGASESSLNTLACQGC